MNKNVKKICRLIDDIRRLRGLNIKRNVRPAVVKGWAVRAPPQSGGMTLCWSWRLAACTLLSANVHYFPLLVPCDIRDPMDDEMNAVLAKSKKLIEAGNLDQAEVILGKALKKTQHANSVWSNILLLLLGKIALKQGQHHKSEEYYKELVKNLSGFLESSPAVERLRLWAAIDLAQLYSETNDFKKAEEHYKYSLFTLEAMSVGAGDFHWAVETLHHVLDGYADLLMASKKYDEALAQREKAHQLCATLYGERHIKLVRSYNEMGRIYTYKGMDDDAIACFDKAIEMCRTLEGVDPMELVALLVNSGRVCLRRGLLKKAREQCQRAFEISGKSGNQLGLAHAKDCLEGVRNAMES